jgi:hypothetical protein
MTSTIHKIKFFSGFHQDFARLENEINQWLIDNSDIHIIHLTQCEISSKQSRDIVVTILFEESPSKDKLCGNLFDGAIRHIDDLNTAYLP